MSAPTESVSATHDTVTIQWSALTTAAETGGLTINKYVVEYKKTADVSYTQIDPATSPRAITGLVPNTAYLFRVYANNDIGDSTPSTTLSVTTTIY